MTKIKCILCILTVTSLMFLCSCGAMDKVLQVTADVTQKVTRDSSTVVAAPSTDSFEFLFHVDYVQSQNIPIHKFSERKAALAALEKAVQEIQGAETEMIFLKETTSWFKTYYEISSRRSDLLYFGDTKNNRPNGTGVIIQLNSSSPNNYYILYAGKFKSGQYNGYGAMFNTKKVSDKNVGALFSKAGLLDSQYIDQANEYLTNYVRFEGEFKKGRLNGKVNEYEIDSEDLVKSPKAQNYWGGAIYPSVKVTEYKKDSNTGHEKRYSLNCLVYDGNVVKGKFDGKGKYYFPNGGKKYDGEWKADQYNGKGTLYDANGNKVYSGKWKDGDYTS